jgi:hypothetical protein
VEELFGFCCFAMGAEIAMGEGIEGLGIFQDRRRMSER